MPVRYNIGTARRNLLFLTTGIDTYTLYKAGDIKGCLIATIVRFVPFKE